MASRRKKLSALVVDPDQGFLEMMMADPRASQIPPILAIRGADAQLIIADPTHAFHSIFINLGVTGPSGISVVKFAYQHRPQTPIYLLHDGLCPLTPSEMAKLGVRDAIAKPITYSQLMERIAPKAIIFDRDAALRSSTRNKDPLDSEILSDDAKFLSIRAADFISGSRSLFDVYVRIRANQYVKIVHGGDVFEPARMETYLKKGIEYFYLRREAQEHYLSYCDQLATALLSRLEKERAEGKTPTLSTQVAAALTLNQGQETLSFLRNQGVSEVNLQYANNFVENAGALARLIAKDNPGAEAIQALLSDVIGYEHGVAVSFIASLLGPALRYSSEKLAQILGTAAMLHDIGLYSSGLYNSSDRLQLEDEENLLEEEKVIYRGHPLAGAEILKRAKGVDPAVIQGIAQHHERINKSGFPMGLGLGQVTSTAEILGISDEFARWIRKGKDNRDINPMQEMESVIYQRFSRPIVDAFLAVYVQRRFIVS